MSTRKTTAPAEAIGPLPALQSVATGLAREAAALDASLDRAFSALRATRSEVTRIANSDLPPGGAGNRSASASHEDMVLHLSDAFNQVADEIHTRLDAVGAPPAVATAARQTAEALEVAAAVLPEETATLDLSRLSDPPTSAELLELCHSEAIALQRRLSAPIGRLMSIMQLRDNIDQRCTHVIACAGLAETYEAASKRVIEMFLNAQVADMSRSVSEGEASVGKAVDAVLSAAGKAQSVIVMAAARVLLPRSAELLSRAVALEEEWGRFDGLSAQSDLLFRAVSGSWIEVATTLLRSGTAPTRPSADTADLIAQKIDFIGKVMITALGIKDETEALAHSALTLDSLADRLADNSIEDPSVDAHHQVLEALWNSYTVDAERHVHENLLRRLGR